MPHALYGVRPAAEAGSAAWWRGEALAAMDAARAAGRVPILCGGTGLYFAALINGLSPIPRSRQKPGQEARGLLADGRAGGAACRGCKRSIRPPPRGCGRPTASASRAPGRCGAAPAAGWPPGRRSAAHRRPGDSRAILLDPPREALRAAIAGRFAAMLAAGALEEVRALLAWGSIRRCRRCGRTACRNWRRICAARSRSQEAARRARAGDRAIHQAAGDLVSPPSRSPMPGRSHTIHARFAGLAQFSEQELGAIVEVY